MIVIDALHLYCPDFTTPVMTLIKKDVPVNTDAIVMTHETRSTLRLQHLCASFGWEYKRCHEKNGVFHHLIERTG